MKRDMDLIRELMLKLEDLAVGPGDNVHILPANGGLLVEDCSVVGSGANGRSGRDFSYRYGYLID
jgi:hypothetical protein